MRSELRQLWIRLHRWIGLGVAVFFAVASFTGAALVYESEIDAWINGGVYPVTPGDVGAEAIAERVRASGENLITLRWPHARAPVYNLETRTADGSVKRVSVDPGSGSVVEPQRRNVPLMRMVRRMHTTLLVGRPGHFLVLGATILGLLSLVTGLVLWWPGRGRLLRGFAVRTGRGFYPFNFDLHQAMGALALPLLFVMLLTGVLASFAPTVERLLSAFTGNVPDGTEVVARPEADAAADGTAAPADAGLLISNARGALPQGAPVALRMPRDEDGPVFVDMLIGPALAAGATVATVRLDAHSGAVEHVRDPRRADAAAQIAGPMMVKLHVGAVGGPVVRLLYALVAFAGAALAVTGVTIWWLKRARSLAKAEMRNSVTGNEPVPANYND
jgi:uncharacterized iron-regulated membrane protein